MAQDAQVLGQAVAEEEIHRVMLAFRVLFGNVALWPMCDLRCKRDVLSVFHLCSHHKQ